MTRGNGQPGLPKAVIFDFDGVILESADIKTAAFVELFADYPEHREAILRHHLENLGVSRYRKFAWIYSELLGCRIEDAESQRLGEAFSQLVLQKILECPFVPGARELLEALRPSCLLFVASGTPQEELEYVVRMRGLDSFFREVWGTPRGKVEIIRSILSRHGLEERETLFIGDGLSDYCAAKETGVHFIARQSPHVCIDWRGIGAVVAPDMRSARALIDTAGQLESTSSHLAAIERFGDGT